MEDATITSTPELPEGAVSVVGGIPIDEAGNALVIDDSTDPADEPQPQQAELEAEAPTEDNSTASEVEVSKELSKDDQNLLNWAKKKGLDTSETPTPGELKALKLARESEQRFHEGQTQRSELQKSLDNLKFQYPQQPAPQLQQTPEPQFDEYGNDITPQPQPQPQAQVPTVDPRDLKIAMLEFRQNHPDYQSGSDLDNELGKVVGENPVFWMNNLDQAYRIAKTNLDSSSFADRLEAAKEEARKEERERLAKQSKTSQPAPQATGKSAKQDFSKLTPQNIDAWLAQVNNAEYAKRINEVNAVLASL